MNFRGMIALKCRSPAALGFIGGLPWNRTKRASQRRSYSPLPHLAACNPYWWCWMDLNHRHIAYEATVLPLNYSTVIWWETVESNHTLLQNGFTDRLVHQHLKPPMVFLQGNDPWSLAYQASALPLSYRNMLIYFYNSRRQMSTTIFILLGRHVRESNPSKWSCSPLPKPIDQRVSEEVW